MRLGPDLIYGPNSVTPRPLPKNKKQDDSIFRNAFYNLLQITPDIFEQTVIGDLGLKTFLLGIKEKVYQERKISLCWQRMMENW